MKTKALSVIRVGVKLLTGFSAGYFVYRITEKKVDEMIKDGGLVNAAVVGVGQGALAVISGQLASCLIG